MIEVNFISAIAVIVLGVMVAWAYLPFISTQVRRWEDYMTAGVIVLVVGLVSRLMYWDVAQAVIDASPVDWGQVRDALGGQKISTVFNVICAFGFYLFLHARILLIPEDVRKKYRWWNAWRYPPGRCLFNWRRKRD